MFVCVDCGNLFEDPEEYVETHGFSSPPYEEWSCCPACGGGFVETFRCDACGEWIDGKYIIFDDRRICEYCYEARDIKD